MGDLKDVNLDRPRWDQSTYFGRARHFFTVANPLNLRYTSRDLDKAKAIVENHRKGLPQQNALTLDELWKAKHIYDSAFHPVTGEKIFILGRMSAQVPMNMIITGNMMLFYKTTPAVVFWQWVNQSFNALVNYCNRSDSDMPVSELAEGIKVIDENNNVIGQSKVAALEATISVVISRVIMAAPSMAVTPLVLNSLEKRGVFRRKPYLQPVLGLGITGLILTFATPLACALFAQTAPIAVGKLEPEIQEKIKKISPSTKTLYYNKGL
ncbi:unnamed protein product [Nesidiocoris tenuis]|uniref:Sidoreflexin n=1 Tax=Nesidiocoris tenuis TaxID=355587 RepID=A0A6H5G2S1_9HEMI|nr:unnamed protein product [Nesidiocoris tenuis]